MKTENKVELLGFYGDDETIACSAWTSTSRNLTDEKRARIPAMIETLWVNGHETPFEKAIVHFLVNVDQATHIHLLKHRMSSFNGESARYKELKDDKFYIPEDWPQKWKDTLTDYTDAGNQLYHQCLKELTEEIGRKRAKESARFFKTYNSQIQADIMFNMRSFANFQKLRNSEHSQLEIREIAGIMLELVKNIDGNPFEHTIEAWGFDG